MAGRKSTTPKRRGRPKKAAGDDTTRVPSANGDGDADADAEANTETEPEAEAGDAEPSGPRDEELEEVAIDDALPAVVDKRAARKDDGGDRATSISRRDPLTAYVQETRRYPLLTREEEHELAVKFAESGDPDAARRLVTANLRLVVKIAHEYRRAYRNLLDLVQEGNMGLMQAVKKYDPYRGVKLSSYAAWWIRAYILKFILNNWRLVKIGTTQAQRKLFFNLRKERETLEKLGFEPEHKLLAERLHVSEAEVADMEMRLGSSEASLDAPLGRDDEGPSRTRLDTLAGAHEERPDVAVEAQELRELLRDKLAIFGAKLDGREKQLFEKRWLTETPATLQEIGDMFSISRERARQIEKRLLGRLREYLEQELGSAVDIGPARDE